MSKAWTKDSSTWLPAQLRDKSVPSLKLLGSSVAWENRDELLAPVHGVSDGVEILAKTTHLVSRVRDLLKAGLRVKSAFLILQTYGNACANHLQRANYEDGPWVQQLEDTLQSGLSEILSFKRGSPSTLTAKKSLQTCGSRTLALPMVACLQNLATPSLVAGPCA